jgi:SpoVK/Ycf46/Vps4 family AAA+-type ATPase
MKTEFMALWDGFSTDQDARVMVLAATNRPWELDEAILRRLPRAFEVGMPDKQQRASILKVILKGEDVAENLDIDWLASLCEGYSGSDLSDLCKQAAYLPIRDLLEEEKLHPEGFITAKLPRKLEQADFETVLSMSRTTKSAAYEYQYTRTNAVGSSQPRRQGSISEEFSVTDLLKLLATFGSNNNWQTSRDP